MSKVSLSPTIGALMQEKYDELIPSYVDRSDNEEVVACLITVQLGKSVEERSVEKLKHLATLAGHSLSDAAIYRLSTKKYISKLPDDDADRWSVNMKGEEGVVDQVDAHAIVEFLKQDKLDNPKRTGAVLVLENATFTEKAEKIICRALQELEGETVPIHGVSMKKMHGLPFIRLLKAMETNKSVKELSIEDVVLTTVAQEGAVLSLLLHKKDFEELSFIACRDSKRLASIVQAVALGKFDSLVSLAFTDCDIAPGWFIAWSNPANFPRLIKLNLDANPEILDSAPITKNFVENMLLSNDTTLEELEISGCSTQGLGYALILKALEVNRRLRQLTMLEVPIMSRGLIRAQLSRSLPEMKGLRYLDIDKGLVNDRDSQNDLKRAFARNTSLLKLKAK